MGGGREILTLISTAAIAGIGTTIIKVRNIVPKKNFFILLPPVLITVLPLISLSCFPKLATGCRPRAQLFLQ
jgi:hypothetical protein